MKAHKLRLTCLVWSDLPYVCASAQTGVPVGFVGPDGREYRPQITWEVADNEKGEYRNLEWEEATALGLDWEYEEVELYQVGEETAQ